MLIHNKKFCFRQINFKDNTFVYSQEFVQYKAKFLILNHKVFDSRVPKYIIKQISAFVDSIFCKKRGALKINFDKIPYFLSYI